MSTGAWLPSTQSLITAVRNLEEAVTALSPGDETIVIFVPNDAHYAIAEAIIQRKKSLGEDWVPNHAITVSKSLAKPLSAIRVKKAD